MTIRRHGQQQKKAYPLSWLRSDLACIKNWASSNHMPGMTAMLMKLYSTRLEPADHIEAHPRGTGRFRMTLNDYEVVHFNNTLQYARVVAAERNTSMQDVLSALVRKAFGNEPQRPAAIPFPVWNLWTVSPLTRNYPEPTIEQFYADMKRHGHAE